MASVVWYSVPELCEESRYKLSISRTVDITRKIDQEDIAEECAEDYYSRPEGWDCSWPQDIVLFLSERGAALVTVKVHMDMSPTFRGRLNDL